jgi:hypothetical protein
MVKNRIKGKFLCSDPEMLLDGGKIPYNSVYVMDIYQYLQAMAFSRNSLYFIEGGVLWKKGGKHG